jgi:hypothetical protein
VSAAHSEAAVEATLGAGPIPGAFIKAQRRPAWMDDREVALDRAAMAREQRHEDWEAIDHALENERMG